MTDSMFPERSTSSTTAPHGSAGQEEVQDKQVTVFDLLGGEPGIQRMVDRFYDLMDLEPVYTELRAAHGPELDRARQHLFWFLCGWTGGPDHFVERFGHPRLKARHMPFSIGIKERDQWVACMDQAMSEEGVPDALIERLNQSFMQTADWMRNR